MRIAALDVGEKRIGVALSDPTGLIATGIETYRCTAPEADLAYLVKRLAELGAERVVVGLPRNMDGSEGFQAQRVRQVGDALAERIDLPLVYWDERMTSLSARQTLRERGVKARQQKGQVDRIAAAYILQHYLDAQGRF
ncbi:MAG: Holliday junction resolvase RuvX [Christensenellales bacterium]|jgi:putative Holliday junction resolvase